LPTPGQSGAQKICFSKFRDRRAAPDLDARLRQKRIRIRGGAALQLLPINRFLAPL